MQAMVFEKPDGLKKTTIEYDGVGLQVTHEGVQLNLDGSQTAEFAYDLGERVTEYLGKATNGETQYSWAIAELVPQGRSAPHHHQIGTEEFYILSGSARVLVDDKTHCLRAGEWIRIHPGQAHTVINDSQSEPLVLAAHCKPAWTIEDFHLEGRLSIPEIDEVASRKSCHLSKK